MIPQIRQVQIRNYKSIGQSVVDLEAFTVLVGPNGSGKTNFVDALAFVQECLSESVEMAFKNRGGISYVRRRSGGHPTHIGIRLVFTLANQTTADYAFEIAAHPKEKFKIARERCIINSFMKNKHEFEVRNGVFHKAIPGIRPKVTADRLALYAASATEEFRPAYDFLTSIRMYSIVPERLRELEEPNPGDFLNRDGSNAAAVLKRLKEDSQGDGNYERLCRILEKVVEGVERVEYRSVGQKETLQFKQDVGLRHSWTFDALNMSNGTLRVLGLLLAVFQPNRPSVIVIEEPEATVHPAAAEIIVQVLLDAAKEIQIIVTTHSPDIIDYKELTDKQIRVVAKEQGRTLIAPVSSSSRQAIRDHLYTPGELLRVDELNPDTITAEVVSNQLSLFGNSVTGESQQ